MAAKYRGCWVPRSRHSLSVRRTHGSSGIPSSAHAQGRDSLNNPLVGFDSSVRPYPMSPPVTSRSKAPLLRFCRPYSVHRRRKSTSRQLPGRAPRFCRESISRSHPADYGAALGFLNLSAVSSSPPRPAIFRQVTLVGFGPTGNYSIHETPDARRRRCALLTFLPWFALPPFLGGDNLGRISRLPRIQRPVPFFDFRAFVFVEVGPRH